VQHVFREDIGLSGRHESTVFPNCRTAGSRNELSRPSCWEPSLTRLPLAPRPRRQLTGGEDALNLAQMIEVVASHHFRKTFDGFFAPAMKRVAHKIRLDAFILPLC
jgi:hypothetical protein